MSAKGASEEQVREEGLYVCADGCERRYYRPGERFLHCAVADKPTTWTRIEEV